MGSTLANVKNMIRDAEAEIKSLVVPVVEKDFLALDQEIQFLRQKIDTDEVAVMQKKVGESQARFESFAIDEEEDLQMMRLKNDIMKT